MSMTLGLPDRDMREPPDTQSTHRVVGIIGGMGPEATVDLMRRVIAKTPARDDEDHVHLIVESNPKIPSRIAHLIKGTGPDPTPELVRIARNLERASAHAIAIPCNTAHVYADAIRASVRIPLLDMVQLTVEQIAQPGGVARVELLASTAVHMTALYKKAFLARGIDTVAPTRQDDVMALIQAVKRGETGARPQADLGKIAREAAGRASVVLIACSELSVIAAGIDVPFVDSLDVLAQAVVKFATLPTTTR
jgi:aspartate racemase